HLALLVGRDLFDGTAREHRLRPLFQDVRLVAFARAGVAPLDQQPVVALLAAGAAYAHQVPHSLELLAREFEVELALGEPLVRIAVWRPHAAVPHQHGAAPVLALRNGALEILILDRMVFHLDREPLVAGYEARPLGDGPTLEHAVQLEAEVVMQAPRRVLL